MSVNDLRELSAQELENKIVDLKKIKKEIAQANTVLTEKLNEKNNEVTE